MPKGKKKGKYEHRRTEVAYSDEDEDAGIDMTNDNYSETSGQSDLRSHDDAGFLVAYRKRQRKPRYPPLSVYIPTQFTYPRLLPLHTESMENEIQEKLEEKVLEIIDALSARANTARAAALVALRNALQRRYLAHLLSGQRVTLAEHITKALRRGKDGERKAAAAVAPLLALQIGEEGTEEFMSEVRPALFAAATDKSGSLETRTESVDLRSRQTTESHFERRSTLSAYEALTKLQCCSSLAVLCYLLEEDLNEILEVMKMFETIFSGSYLKGDGTVKVSGAAVEEGGWHAAALDGWALLLGATDAPHAASLLRERAPSFTRLAEMLDACSLEVRISAGCALAAAHERAAAAGGDVAWDEPAAAPRLLLLARDSHKYRAKRDRKVQRATFRDILKYFEEGTIDEERVRVGVESVCLDSWSCRGAYSALAGALGAGLALLAPHCTALRDALDLPPAAPAAAPKAKLNKLQRHLQNTAACKARTLARNKSRDKRSAALAL